MKHVDVIVLGSGIAGLSVADAARQLHKSCAVIDCKPPGSGASSAPAMLVNPATGRRAKKSWKFEQGYEAMHPLLQRIEHHSKTNFFEKNGVIRPALTPKIAKDFRKSPEKYGWEKGWLQWVDEAGLAREYPFLGKSYGGLFIEKAITVHGHLFNQLFIDYLSFHGVLFSFNKSPDIHKKQYIWHIKGNDFSYSSPILIDATGASQAVSKTWGFLPMHRVKGQTATYTFQKKLPLQSSVSGLGYLAYFSGNPRELTVGSTYEHQFEHENPDDAGLETLNKKLRAMLPGFFDKIASTKQWAGVRVTLPDKKPVIGEHPEQKHLFIIGGLGSKGLLLGRYLAEVLVHHIFRGTKINEKVSISRFRV